jgi:hypothetical protein
MSRSSEKDIWLIIDHVALGQARRGMTAEGLDSGLRRNDVHLTIQPFNHLTNQYITCYV